MRVLCVLQVVCMPGGKICYNFQDAYNSMLTKAVLTRANDPTEATLYAAKFTQTTPSGGKAEESKFNIGEGG